MKLRSDATQVAAEASGKIWDTLKFFSLVLARYSLVLALWLWNFTKIGFTPLDFNVCEMLMSSHDMATSSAFASFMTASSVEVYAFSGIT